MIKSISLFLSILLLTLCLSSCSSGSQDLVSKLHRGINFDVSPPGEVDPFKMPYDPAHLDAIKAAGFQSIRIFVVAMREPSLYQPVIDEALERGLAVIIVMWGNSAWMKAPLEGIEDFASAWESYALYYKDYPEELVFELWNEPGALVIEEGEFSGIEEGSLVMEYLNRAIPVIRSSNPDRLLGIGGPGLNGCRELEQYVTPEYLDYKLVDGSGFLEDDRLIGTIHMYEPGSFTHWTMSLEDLPDWKETVRETLGYAVSWAEKWNKPLLLSEWGAWATPKGRAGDYRAYLGFVAGECGQHDINWIYYSFGFNDDWAFNIYHSEEGWNRDALEILTGNPGPAQKPLLGSLQKAPFPQPEPVSAELDSYGGLKAKLLGQTGFFHTAHDGDRWWFVTPEGHAFLSFGINHYHEGWWTEDYNLEHWLSSFGAQEVGDVNWNEGFRKTAKADLERLGINTLGWHTDARILTDRSPGGESGEQPGPGSGKARGAIVPYLRSFKPIILDHYRRPGEEAFMDVFSPEFEVLCHETARRIAAPYADDPMLLGYSMNDCPIFTDMDISAMGGSTSWSRILRNLGRDAAGKQAYVALMQDRYENIAEFNRSYASSFASWEELLSAENWQPNAPPVHPAEKADNLAFTLSCVDRYYAVSKAALEKADPNHLFLGDKLNANTDNLEKVLEVAARYVDVIVYQFYGSLDEQSAILDRLAPRVELPFVNGDIGFSVPTEMMPAPYGPHAKDQAERGQWLVENTLACFERPEFIGWHMCGVIDTWKTMPTKEVNQHQGIMSVTGEFYPEMEEAIRKIADEMYPADMN